MKIFKTFHFEAAHILSKLPASHKCSRLHGHNWRTKITVQGDVSEDLGWVCDYDVIEKAWAPLFEKLDHALLNDVTGLENPTSENVACWIFENIQKNLPFGVSIFSVEVSENCTSGAIYEGGR